MQQELQIQPRPKLEPSGIEVLPDPALRWLSRPENCKEPWPGSAAQARALDCDADIALLGGAAGSLKTSSLLLDAIMERDYPTMRSYFFRRTYKELEGGDGAIDQAYRLFSQTGALGYNASTHTWKWPSRGEFYFRHAQHEKDVYPYQGHAMSFLGIDESTHWPEKMVRYLITRNRSTDPNLKVRVRLGTNPGNVGHCVDEGDVLTPHGWTPIQELKVGEPVYSLDDAGELITETVDQIHAEQHDGFLVRAHTGCLYISCTPDHRVAKLGGRRGAESGKHFTLVPFSDLPGQTTILRTVQWMGTPLPPIELARCSSRQRRNRTEQPLRLGGTHWAALLGWFLSEGNVHIDRKPARSRVDIAQSRPQGRERLSHFLRSCGFRPRWNERGASIYSREWASAFQHFGKCREKFVPREVKNAGTSELRAFLDAAMEGDGHWVRRGLSGCYYTISRQLADDVAEIALKLGYIVRQKERQRRNRNGLSYEVYIQTNRSGGTELLTGQHSYKVATRTKRRSDIRLERYTGMVYCIGVRRTHNFIIRQRGSVWVSGNSWHQKLFLGGVCPHCEPEKAPPQWYWSTSNDNPTLRWDCRWPSDGQPLELDLGSRKVRLSVSYVLSSVRDHSMYPVEYQARLKMQSPATAKALLEGCWRIFEGQYFDVWEPYRIGRPMVVTRRSINEQWWWPRWVSSDYGFSISASAAHLWLHEPQSEGWPRGRVYCVEEDVSQETAANFGRLLLKKWVLGEDDKPLEYRWMPWYLSPDAFREIGVPFTIAGQINEQLARYGRGFTKADNDRAGGAVKIYTGLETGELVVCEDCKQSIEAIESRIHDPDHENDVLKVPGDPLDDVYESFRYGWKSFETARAVTTPATVRIQERLKQEFKDDPTGAMFRAQKIKEEEENRNKPKAYVGSGLRRRQIAEWERNRRH